MRKHVIVIVLIVGLVAVCQLSAVVQAQSAEDLKALNAQLKQLYRQGKYTEAVPIAEKLLSLTEEKYGLDHVETATALNNLALIYIVKGRYPEAESRSMRAQKIYENRLGKESPCAAISFDHLEEIYQKTGRLADAKRAQEKAAAIRKKAEGKEAICGVLKPLEVKGGESGTPPLEVKGGESGTVPHEPETKSGDRLSTFWNVWAEDGEGPRFEPVTNLKPNTSYRISIDLAALQYIAAGAIAFPTSQTFNGEVEKWVKPGMPDPVLKVILLADPGKFETSPTIEDFKINLTQLRKVWKSGSAHEDGDHFKTLRERFDKKEEPDWKFGGIFFDVKTKNAEGMGTIAFSIWDKQRPIDEVSVSFCIAKSPEEAKERCGDLKQTTYPQGLLSVRLAAENSESPVIALHFVELSHDKRVFGILRSKLWTADKYLAWQLDQTADKLSTTISTQFMSSIDKPISDENLLVRGETLLELLFPANAQSVDGRKVRDELLSVIRPYLQKDPSQGDYIPPTLFVRMIKIGAAPSLPLPLGLLAVRRDVNQKMTRENGQFLGEYFLIETPLEIQTYAPSDECLSKWVMLLPPPDYKEDRDINDARSQLGSTIFEWTKNLRAKLFNKMTDFMAWIGPSSIGQPKESPVVLVTLSHHDSSNLYFFKIDSDQDNPLPFCKVNRTFKEPSVAILNGCGTGGLSAVEMIRRLNWQGFSSVVATSAEVDGLMAGAFLKIFTDEISKSGTSKQENLGMVYWKSVRKLSQTKPTGVTPSIPFGAQALKYCLLGNGKVTVCVPKGPNQ